MLHGVVLAVLQFALLTPLHAADAPVQLTPAHRAMVDHQRRIFFQYDPSADIQRKGGFGSDMDAVMNYVFDAASQPGSQLDAICIDVSNEGVTATAVGRYHSTAIGFCRAGAVGAGSRGSPNPFLFGFGWTGNR